MQILFATLRGVVHQQQRAAANAALLPSLFLNKDGSRAPYAARQPRSVSFAVQCGFSVEDETT